MGRLLSTVAAMAWVGLVAIALEDNHSKKTPHLNAFACLQAPLAAAVARRVAQHAWLRMRLWT